MNIHHAYEQLLSKVLHQNPDDLRKTFEYFNAKYLGVVMTSDGAKVSKRLEIERSIRTSVHHHELAIKGELAGYYGVNGKIHPCQDPSFPFIYSPHTDEYIGFRWDYGEEQPMVPPLTNETLQRLTGLYLSPSPSDLFGAVGEYDCRFSIVFFKKPLTYQSMETKIGPDKILYAPLFGEYRESSGEYFATALHPNARSLKDVGWEAIINQPLPGSPRELYLLDPLKSVTRSLWYEWRKH